MSLRRAQKYDTLSANHDYVVDIYDTGTVSAD
jgi:hypothetical protein